MRRLTSVETFLEMEVDKVRRGGGRTFVPLLFDLDLRATMCSSIAGDELKSVLISYGGRNDDQGRTWREDGAKPKGGEGEGRKVSSTHEFQKEGKTSMKRFSQRWLD